MDKHPSRRPWNAPWNDRIFSGGAPGAWLTMHDAISSAVGLAPPRRSYAARIHGTAACIIAACTFAECTFAAWLHETEAWPHANFRRGRMQMRPPDGAASPHSARAMLPGTAAAQSLLPTESGSGAGNEAVLEPETKRRWRGLALLVLESWDRVEAAIAGGGDRQSGGKKGPKRRMKQQPGIRIPGASARLHVPDENRLEGVFVGAGAAHHGHLHTVAQRAAGDSFRWRNLSLLFFNCQFNAFMSSIVTIRFEANGLSTWKQLLL